MKTIKIALFVCFIVSLSACTTTIYIVRHAEKVDNSQQAVLSSIGLQRANVLRDSLLNKGIDSIFATTFTRTQQTATPLANALHKRVIIYNKDTCIQFIQNLNKIKNRNFLVVGHSDNVPEIVNALTGQTVVVADTVFNKMFIVKTKRCLSKKVSLIQTTY
jgi:phosphohistidine phosphatase SixA